MNFKKDIETLLERLKNKGYTRGEIETELGYAENYIDQALSKGGNRRFLNALGNLDKRLLTKAIPEKRVINEADPLEKAIENLTYSHREDSDSLKELIYIWKVKHGIIPMFPTEPGPLVQDIKKKPPIKDGSGERNKLGREG